MTMNINEIKINKWVSKTLEDAGLYGESQVLENLKNNKSQGFYRLEAIKGIIYLMSLSKETDEWKKSARFFKDMTDDNFAKEIDDLAKKEGKKIKKDDGKFFIYTVANFLDTHYVPIGYKEIDSYDLNKPYEKKVKNDILYIVKEIARYLRHTGFDTILKKSVDSNEYKIQAIMEEKFIGLDINVTYDDNKLIEIKNKLILTNNTSNDIDNDLSNLSIGISVIKNCERTIEKFLEEFTKEYSFKLM